MPLRADHGSVECALKRIAFDTAESGASSIDIARVILSPGSPARSRTRCSRRSVLLSSTSSLSVPLGASRWTSENRCSVVPTASSLPCRWAWMTPARPSPSAQRSTHGQVIAPDLNVARQRGLLVSSIALHYAYICRERPGHAVIRGSLVEFLSERAAAARSAWRSALSARSSRTSRAPARCTCRGDGALRPACGLGGA